MRALLTFILLLALQPAVWCDDPVTITAIEKAWRARAKATANIRLEWTERKTLARGAINDVPGETVIPDKEMQVPPQKCQLIFEHGVKRFRLDVYGTAAHEADPTAHVERQLTVVTPLYWKTFNSTLAAPAHYGAIYKGPRKEFFNGQPSALPYLLPVRPFLGISGLGEDLGRFRVLEERAEIDGRKLRVLRKPYGPFAFEIFVDPQQDYIPVSARLIDSGGGMQFDYQVTETRRHESIYLPTAWAFTSYKKGVASTHHSAEVTRVEIGADLSFSDAQFDVEFPPGTLWWDEKTGKDYLVQKDGTSRTTTAAERSNGGDLRAAAKILGRKPPELPDWQQPIADPDASRWAVWLWAGFAIALAGGVFFFLWRRARRTS